MYMIRRVAKLGNPYFLGAVGFGLLHRLGVVRVHRVLLTELKHFSSGKVIEHLPSMEMHVLRSEDDLTSLATDIETELNEQSGMSCRGLIAEGDAIYFMSEGGRVTCQLNICHNAVRVNTPTDLIFQLDNGDAFLNYLYTREKHRRKGLAGTLMRFACQQMKQDGMKRCFAHVRATNYASLTTLKQEGWTAAGWILTSASGRMLGAPGTERLGIKVLPVKTA